MKNPLFKKKNIGSLKIDIMHAHHIYFIVVLEKII